MKLRLNITGEPKGTAELLFLLLLLSLLLSAWMCILPRAGLKSFEDKVFIHSCTTGTYSWQAQSVKLHVLA